MPEDYSGEGFQCLSAAQAGTARFKGYRFIGKFLILNVEYPDGKYPEDILRDIFGKVTKQLENGIHEMGLNANHFLFQFDSSLMDHSVPLHLHELNTDSIEVSFFLTLKYLKTIFQPRFFYTNSDQ